MTVRAYLMLFFTSMSLSYGAIGAPVARKEPCPDLSGQWSCQACNNDRGPFQTGYSFSQTVTGAFTDYEMPGYPEPSRYTAHSQRRLDFGTASTSCKDGRKLIIEMRNSSQKKTMQTLERAGVGHVLVETKENGVNQFGNSYENVRLEVCVPEQPKTPCPTCPLIPPTPPARGDECELLRAESARLQNNPLSKNRN